MRLAASLIAAVARCTSLSPNRRIIRSRRSSRCSSTKMMNTSTMPAVAIGCRSGPTKVDSAASGAGGGS